MKHYTLLIVALFATLSSYAIAPITGPTTVCAGDTIILSDATSGGTWSSSATATASVGTSGYVIGIAAGVATISYTSGGSTATINVTVNALPMLSSSLSPTPICDSQIFNYPPTGTIAGSTFAWSRAAIPGIANIAATGIGNPNEQLYNTTAYVIPVVYTYTLSANGCNKTENVVTTVNPTPMLSSPLTIPDICDSTYMVVYIPTSYTPGTWFEYNRAGIPGIIPVVSFAPNPYGVISESISDTSHTPLTVTYRFRLQINGCFNLFTQLVTLKIDTCAYLSTPIPMKEQPLEIMPNPTTDKITISNLQPGDEIEIYSLLGKKVFNGKQLPGSSATIDLSNEPSGMYYARINSAGIIRTQKIVKQ